MDRIVITYNSIDHELDLPAGELILLNKKYNEIGNPYLIKSEITKTVQLAKTWKNRKCFGNLGYRGATNYVLISNMKAKYYSDGICIMKDAQVFLTDSGDTYELVLKHGNGNFFDQIKNASINDLDLSDLKDIWDKSTIITKNTNTTGIIYGLIDWGNMASHPTYFESGELFPCVFLKTLMDAIFDSAKNSVLTESWNYDGSIFSSEDFTKLVIPVKTQELDAETIGNCLSTASDTGSVVISDGDPFCTPLTGASFDPYSLFESITRSDGFDADPANAYVCPKDGSYTFKVSGQLTLNSIAGGHTQLTFEVRLTKNDIVSVPVGLIELELNSLTSYDFDQSFTIECNSGEAIFLSFENVDFLAGDSIELITRQLAITGISFKDNMTVLGLDFPISGNLHDIKQDELIKQVMNFFCLIPVCDTNSKTIFFERFDKTRTNYEGLAILDLTSKLDTRKKISNSYSLFDLDKKNWFRWSIDSKDNLPVSSGESFFELTGVNYIGEGDFFTSIFAFSKISGNYTSFDVPLIGLFESGERKNDFSPRIFKLNSSALTATYRQEGVDPTTEVADIPVMELLDWGNLQASYWDFYIQLSDNPDTPECYFRLSVENYKNFDFSKPIFIKGMGYYQCQGVEGFAKNKSSKLNLVKIKS